MHLSLRPRRLTLVTLLVILLMLILALAVSADTVTVTSTLDSGVGTLRQALSDANPGDVIVFSVSTPATITVTTGAMPRSGELTITGPGSDQLTISGSSVSRAIESSSALTITGMTIRDCRGTDGGAIVCTGDVSMTDVTLLDNTGTNSSGAFSAHDVTLTDCDLVGNTAGTYFGAFYGSGDVTLTGCALISNTSGSSYGVFENGGNVAISDSLLQGNAAQAGNAGAFYSPGNVTLTNTDLISNTASDYHGAFQSTGHVTVSDCLLQGNTAATNGAFYSGNGVTMTDTQLISNTARSDANGAFYALGDVSLFHTDLISNTAGTGVGAFHTNASCVISGCQIISNTAQGGDYGAFYALDTVTMTSTELISNTAKGHNGAFYAGNNVTLTDTQLINNTAQGGQSGAFYTLGSAALTGSELRGNMAGGWWGAFFADKGCVISGTQMISNTAGGQYGAFYTNMTVTMTSTQVVSNTAGTSYGAFEGDSVTISDCLFQGNTAQAGDAGGFLAHGALSINDSQLISNTSSQAGGAVYAEDQVSVANTTFRGNGAGYGGGLYITGSGAGLDMRDCVVADSPSGGGLGLDNGPVAVIENTTIYGNHSSAASSGGGIHIAGDLVAGTELHLLHCTLTDNDATIDGGGIKVFQAQAWLTNTLVSGNTLSIGDHDPSDITGAVTSGGGNLVGDGTGSTGLTDGVNGDQVGTDAAPIDAVTGDLGDYGGDTETVPLLPGSPAIDMGTGPGSPASDQRGVARDGSPDVGSYEARAFGLGYVSGGGQSTLVNTQFSDPLVAQVTGTAGDPVDGGVVVYSAPPTGASATLTPVTATISGGQVSTSATANSTAGSYLAQATLPGLTPVTFDLENTSAAVHGPGSPWIRNYGTVAGGWTDFGTFPRWAADVNGDGLCDVVAFGNKATYVSLCTGGALSGPQEWIRMYGPSAGGWTDYDTFPRMLGDVNGDGMDDIVAFGNRATYVSLSTGSGFLPPAEWIGLFGPSAGGWNSQDTFPRMLGDVNGDGRDDIVAFGNRATYVSLSTGASFLPPGEWIGLYGPAAGGWTSYDTFPRFIDDVNGDGLDDIVAFGNRATYVSYSTGSSFGPPTEWAIGLGPAAGGWMTQDGQTRLVGDIDGDGKTDIVAFGGSATYAWKSTTQTLGLFSWFYTNDRGWTSQNLYPRDLGDATGDGKLDVVGFGSDGVYVQAAP